MDSVKLGQRLPSADRRAKSQLANTLIAELKKKNKKPTGTGGEDVVPITFRYVVARGTRKSRKAWTKKSWICAGTCGCRHRTPVSGTLAKRSPRAITKRNRGIAEFPQAFAPASEQ